MTYEPVESPEYIEYCEEYHYGYTMGVNTEHRVSIRKTFGFDGPFYFTTIHWPGSGFEKFNGILPRPYVDTMSDGTYLTPLGKRNRFLNSLEPQIMIPKGTIGKDAYDGRKFPYWETDEYGLMEKLSYKYPPFASENEVWNVTSRPANDTETPVPPIEYKAGVDPYDKGDDAETSKAWRNSPIFRYKTMSEEEFNKEVKEMATYFNAKIAKEREILIPLVLAGLIFPEKWEKLSLIDKLRIESIAPLIEKLTL